MFVGRLGLILAAAGPRWGKGGDAGVVVGRDVVVILDLSRSMTAADMADPVHQQRWEAARAGLHDLVDGVQQRGGHRLALVVFAARPWVVCPLTSDYDHFRARLDEFSPTAPPPEVRPDPELPIVTGTGIGAALRMGLAAHDPRFPGYQDMLFRRGRARRRANRRASRMQPIDRSVHVVGLGDRRIRPICIRRGDAVELLGRGFRAILRDIVRRTGEIPHSHEPRMTVLHASAAPAGSFLTQSCS